MNKNKAFLDPSLWILAGTNLYMLWYYYQHPEIFTTLVWTYWGQSVLLGLFNFLDMLTIRKVVPATEAIGLMSMKVPAAFFFLFHYGFFHLGYFMFLFTMKASGSFRWELFKGFLLAFLLGQIVSFVQHKIQQRKEQASIGRMFFTPYLRIIPMHLTILIPNFLPVTNLGVFVVLKSITDVLMYMLTSKASKKNSEMDKVSISLNQNIP